MVDISGYINALLKAIELIDDRKNKSASSKHGASSEQGLKDAISKVMDAVLATKAYLYDTENSVASREQEHKLSQAWKDAAYAIQEYDFRLYEIAQIKALAWADPREWKRVENNPDIVKLDLIIEQCNYLQSKQKNQLTLRRPPVVKSKTSPSAK